MRMAARSWRTFGAMLLVLAPWLLLPWAAEAPVVFRGQSPANNLRRAPTRGQLQQELLGINPDRLILYAPMPADTGVFEIPRR